jgi:hypothetical protein
MKKMMAMILVLGAGLWVASCAEPATEDEINQMCQHLGDISGTSGAPGAAAAEVVKVNAEYDVRAKKLEDESAEAAGKIAAEQDAMTAETKQQDTVKRAAIVAEYGKKTAAKASEFGAKMQALKEERDAAVGKAQALADTEEAARNETVSKCLAESRGVSKPVAQCRIAAATADEYENKCK